MGVQKMAISALIERSLEVFNENSHLATWYGRPISPATDDVVNDDHDDHDEDHDCLPLGNLSTKLHLCLSGWLAPFLRLSTIPQWFREQWKFESGELVKRYVDFYFHRFCCAAAGRIRIPISAFTKSK